MAGDFRRYLRTARGSALELETELLIAARRKYLSADVAENLVNDCIRVAQMINGLMRYLGKRQTANS